MEVYDISIESFFVDEFDSNISFEQILSRKKFQFSKHEYFEGILQNYREDDSVISYVRVWIKRGI